MDKKIRELFRVNQLLEVYDKQKGIYFKSIVQGVDPDNLVIGVPMAKREMLQMQEGQSFSLRLLAKDAQYFFSSTVLGQKVANGLLLYLISWPEEVTRYQRRQYYRLPFTLKVHCWLVQDDDGTHSPEQKKAVRLLSCLGGLKEKETIDGIALSLGKPEKALTADISGGGIQMINRRRYAVNSRLILRLFLKCSKKEKELMVLGRVVWMYLPKEKMNLPYRHAVKFEDIDERLRDEIVAFVFALERERFL
ncbi:MAG: hypothetical protein GX767_01400 [Firmicutes bacterium]|nr:hypothetical protein [Bacillota bacterium]